MMLKKAIASSVTGVQHAQENHDSGGGNGFLPRLAHHARAVADDGAMASW